METINVLRRQLTDTSGQYVIATLLVVAFVSAVYLISASYRKGPPSLRDPIPCVFNTVQYALFNDRFMDRVRKIMRDERLVKFRLFNIPVFLVRGQENVRTIFTSSYRVGNEHLMETMFFPTIYDMPLEDIRRFAQDKSGRGHVAAPGSEHLPIEKRFWFGYEKIYSENLSRNGDHLRPIAEHYAKCYGARLVRNHAAGDWTTISVVDLARQHIAESNTEALFGPGILELNPELIPAFWAFDKKVFARVLGLPRWLFPAPYQKQHDFFDMIRKYINSGWEAFDWDSPNADAAWEPLFGARVCREVVKWVKENGFSDQAAIGSLGMLVFGVNSNTIPTTMWTIMEVVKDPELLKAVREEVSEVYVKDPATGARTIDVERVVKLPLLQSIFTEVLRLHMNFNLLRYVNQPITMDGYVLSKGTMVSTPTALAHYNEEDWGREGHPASEFWAERHIKYKEEKDDTGTVTLKRVYSLAGRPSSYFPFGGGQQICPGRYLSKHQVLTSVALLVSGFEIEATWWTKLDGSPADRPAQNDARYSGTGSVPPDRDLVIRCKRIG